MDIIDFYNKVIKIKEVKRIGWEYKDINNSESISDHSFGLALLALLINLPDGINRTDLVNMAIVHDLGAAKTGDVIWEKGSFSDSKKLLDKRQNKENALNYLFESSKDNELLKLSKEFLFQDSKTAEFLKELEKLEMVFQALEYEKKVNSFKLDEFWINADKYIKSPQVRIIFDKLTKLRSDFRE